MALGDFLIQSTYEPKQNYKFIVQMGNPARMMFEVKTASKPKLNFGVVTLNAVDGTSVHYPASPGWDPVTLKFMAGGIDVMQATKDTDVSRGMVELLINSGYDRYGERQYKSDTADAFSEILIRQINSDGNMIEEWSLINPFFESISFGDLDYSSDALSEVTVTIRYDHAEVKFADGPEVVREPTTFLR
jgi:hypothetical protein